MPIFHAGVYAPITTARRRILNHAAADSYRLFLADEVLPVLISLKGALGPVKLMFHMLYMPRALAAHARYRNEAMRLTR